MLFQKKKKQIDQNLQLVMNNMPIEKKTSTKFLGMIIDDQLNWHDHIQLTKTKLSSSMFILNQAKHYLSKKYLLTLYYSLVYPYITYGLTLWGGTHKAYTKKIFILQKKAIRVINKAKYNDHTHRLFKDLKVLKLPDLYSWQVSKFMYRFSNKMLPMSLSNIFTVQGNVHNYGTRNVQSVSVPLHKTSAVHKSLFHIGPITWNNIDNNLKQSKSLSIFKNKLKSQLLETYT